MAVERPPHVCVFALRALLELHASPLLGFGLLYASHQPHSRLLSRWQGALRKPVQIPQERRERFHQFLPPCLGAHLRYGCMSRLPAFTARASAGWARFPPLAKLSRASPTSIRADHVAALTCWVRIDRVQDPPKRRQGWRQLQVQCHVSTECPQPSEQCSYVRLYHVVRDGSTMF